MISMFVSIRVLSGFRDRFIEATLDDAKGSVSNESGCFRFDVLKDDEDPNLVHLYEVYSDLEAIETHRNMPHYKKWQSEVKDWRYGEAVRIQSSTVFPTDDGWRSQKHHLRD